MQLFNRYVSTRSLTVFAGELLLIFGSVALAAVVQGTPDLAANLWKIGLVTLVCQLCLYYNDFYDLTLVHSNRELIVRLLQAAGAASIVLAALYFVLPELMIGNGIFVSALFVFLVAILGWRLVFNQVTRLAEARRSGCCLSAPATPRARSRGRFSTSTSSPTASSASSTTTRRGSASASSTRRSSARRPTSTGSSPSTTSTASSSACRTAAASCRSRSCCARRWPGIRVEDATTTYERVTGKILIDDLRPSWLIFSDGFRVSRRHAADEADDRSRRCRCVAGGADAAADGRSPRSLVLLEDGRPVLYRQERVGENGRTFTLAKFRSMRKDAEKGGTPIWAKDGDDRVTRVGRFIRKTRLDELPQLWNVLRGDMSFVGPRPERPFFVDQLSREIPVLPAAPRRQARADRLGAGEVPLRRLARGRDGEAALRPLLHQAPVGHLRSDDRLRHGQGRAVPQGGGVSPRGRQATGSSRQDDRPLRDDLPQRRDPLPRRSPRRC